MVQNFKIRGDIKLLPKREEQTSPSINYSMLCYAMVGYEIWTKKSVHTFQRYMIRSQYLTLICNLNIYSDGLLLLFFHSNNAAANVCQIKLLNHTHRYTSVQ